MLSNAAALDECILLTRTGSIRGSQARKLNHAARVEDDFTFETRTDWKMHSIEQDCACDAGFQLMPVLEVGLYQLCDSVYLDTIAPGYSLALPPASPVGPVVMNQPAQRVWRSFRAPRPLESTLDRWLAQAGLLQPLGPTPPVPPASTGLLTAWMHLTDACNLACPYCYVPKAGRTMPLEVGLRAVNELFDAAQQGGWNGVKIKFAGGEATMLFDRIRALHQAAQRRAALTGLDFKSVVLSNGVVLLETDARWLAETGTRLMISLDGVGRAHDQLRSTRSGAGTFAQIERNIDALLLPNGVRPSISITITGQNTDAAAEAARWALERDLPISLNFYRVPLTQAGPDALALQADRVVTGMRAVYAVVEELLPEQPLLNGLLDRFRAEAHDRTCGAGVHYQVIGPDGQRAPCHMLLDPNLQTSPAADLRNVPVTEKAACTGCAFMRYCTGGCPLEAFRVSNQWDAPSPNCAIYRALIPAALRLEGLRLMKVNHLL